jgi:hypothetical protein
MSELITETILPGTYIEVRAEGLLSIGAIATGNVGLVGTSDRGSTDLARLSSFADATARFGDPGEWDSNAKDANLSLVRAAQLLFDNGATTVYALRALDPASVAATFGLGAEGNGAALTLQAKSPGTWGNKLQIRVEPADERDLVADELLKPVSGSYRLSATRLLPPAQSEGGGSGGSGSGGAGEATTVPEPSLGNVVVEQAGLSQRFQLRTSAAPQTVRVDPLSGALTFPSAPAATADVRASYWVPSEWLRRVTLRYANQQEVYVVPSLSYLAQRLADPDNPSKLVEVVSVTGDGRPERLERFRPFTAGANGTTTVSHVQAALDRLLDEDVQIVVIAGLPFSKVKSAVLAHVEKSENLGRERIAVVGADSSDPDTVLENANEVADKRVVLVAPAVRATDPDTGRPYVLSPAYAAAAVAGRMASLPPHVSLTNKTLSVESLDRAYNYGELKALVQNRVLALQPKRGVRVVKGITTHDEAFTQITLRRIVDYVKVGTRMGANQYIGKLNNRRVREALRTTLDGFLSDLVLREFLTGYRLSVSADRAMEIRGEVLVTMDLNPTFSIDVIRVVMNLS